MENSKNTKDEKTNKPSISKSQISQNIANDKSNFLKKVKKENIDISDDDKRLIEFKKYLTTIHGEDRLSDMDESYREKLTREDTKWVKMSELKHINNTIDKSNSDEKIWIQQAGTKIWKMAKDGNFGAWIKEADFQLFCTNNKLDYDSATWNVSLNKNSDLNTIKKLVQARKDFAKSKWVDIDADASMKINLDKIVENSRDSQEKVMMTSIVRKYEKFFLDNDIDVLDDFRSKFGDYCDGGFPNCNSTPNKLSDITSMLETFVLEMWQEPILSKIWWSEKYTEILKKLKKTRISYKDIANTWLAIWAYNSSPSNAMKIKDTEKAFYQLVKKLHTHEVASDKVDTYTSNAEQLKQVNEIFKLDKYTNLTGLFQGIQANTQLWKDNTPDYKKKTTKTISDEIIKTKESINSKSDQIANESDPKKKDEFRAELSHLLWEQKKLEWQMARLQEPTENWLWYFDEIEKKYWISWLAKALEYLRRNNRDSTKLDPSQTKLFAKALLEDKLATIQKPENLEMMSRLSIDPSEHTEFLRNLYDIDSESFDIRIPNRESKSKIYFARDSMSSELLKGFYSNPITTAQTLDNFVNDAKILYGATIDLGKSMAENPEVWEFLYNAFWTTPDYTNPLFKFKSANSVWDGEILTENTKVTITHTLPLTEINKKIQILKKKSNLTKDEQLDLNYRQNIYDNGGKITGYPSHYGPNMTHTGLDMMIYDRPVNSPTGYVKDRKILGFVRWNDEKSRKLDIDDNDRKLQLTGSDLDKLSNASLIANTAEWLTDKDREQFDAEQKMYEDMHKMNQWLWNDTFKDEDITSSDETVQDPLEENPEAQTEKEIFDKWREGMVGKWKLEKWSIVVKYNPDMESIVWWSSTKPKNFYQRVISDIDDDFVTLKSANWETKVNSETIKLPRNEKWISTFKKVLWSENLHKYPKLEDNFENYIKDLSDWNTSEVTKKWLDTISKFKLNSSSVPVDPNKQSEEIVLVSTKQDSYMLKDKDGNKIHDNAKSSSSFLSFKKSWNKFKVKWKFLGYEKNYDKDGKMTVNEKKVCDYTREIEMDYASFVAFLWVRDLKVQSKEIAEESYKMTKEGSDAKDEWLPSKPRNRISWKAAGITIKKRIDTLKSGLDGMTQDDADEMNNRAMDSGFFKKISGMPFVWGIFSGMHYKYKLERDANIWKKVQWYIDTEFNTDLHHSHVIIPEIIPLISSICEMKDGKPISIKHWASLSFGDRQKAIAAMHYMAKKSWWLYARWLKWLSGRGFRIYAIYGEWMRKQYMIEKDKLESWSTEALNLIPDLELNMMSDGLTWWKYSVLSGDKNKQFNWLYSRKFAWVLKDIKDTLNGEDSWRKEQESKNWLMSFGFAKEEAYGNFDNNIMSASIWDFFAMYDLAESEDDFDEVRKFSLILLLSKTFWYNTTAIQKLEFEKICRKMSIPRLQIMLNQNWPVIMTSALNVSSKWKFWEIVEYSPNDILFHNRPKELKDFRSNFDKRWSGYGTQSMNFLANDDPSNEQNIIYYANSTQRPLLYGDYDVSDHQANLKALVWIYNEWWTAWKIDSMDKMSSDWPVYSDSFQVWSKHVFGNLRQYPSDPSDRKKFNALRWAVQKSTEKIKSIWKMPDYRKAEFENNFNRFLMVFGGFLETWSTDRLASILWVIKRNNIRWPEAERMVANYIMWPAIKKDRELHPTVKNALENMIHFFVDNIDMLTTESIAKLIDDDNGTNYATKLFQNPSHIYIPIYEREPQDIKTTEQKNQIQSNIKQKYYKWKDIINQEMDDMFWSSYYGSRAVGIENVDMLTDISTNAIKKLYPKWRLVDRESSSNQTNKPNIAEQIKQSLVQNNPEIVGLDIDKQTNNPNINTNQNPNINKKTYNWDQNELIENLIREIEYGSLSSMDIENLTNTIQNTWNQIFIPSSIRSNYTNPESIPSNITPNSFQMNRINTALNNKRQYLKQAS